MDGGLERRGLRRVRIEVEAEVMARMVLAIE
jgi:hypothetical protein